MSPKILLVDDNEDLLLITQIILKGQGYDTVLARSIEEAEKKIRIHQPALLLLDICIGAGDGRQFCAAIKHRPETEGTKVILMSGDDCPDNRNTCADGFLSKPFDFNELVATVQSSMQLEMARS